MRIMTFVIGFFLGFVVRVADSHIRDCGTGGMARAAFVAVAGAVGLIMCVTIARMADG